MDSRSVTTKWVGQHLLMTVVEFNHTGDALCLRGRFVVDSFFQRSILVYSLSVSLVIDSHELFLLVGTFSLLVSLYNVPFCRVLPLCALTPRCSSRFWQILFVDANRRKVFSLVLGSCKFRKRYCQMCANYVKGTLIVDALEWIEILRVTDPRFIPETRALLCCIASLKLHRLLL